jgi:flagellar biosynthesis/type III secretory pathway chaperone
VEHSEDISAILVELEQVLAEEHRALLVLDREAIERAGEHKLLLDQRLRVASREAPPRAEHLDGLARVKRAALKNQLLIVHARASVQSVLSMVSGGHFDTYPGSAPARTAPPPLRVSFRG